MASAGDTAEAEAAMADAAAARDGDPECSLCSKPADYFLYEPGRVEKFVCWEHVSPHSAAIDDQTDDSKHGDDSGDDGDDSGDDGDDSGDDGDDSGDDSNGNSENADGDKPDGSNDNSGDSSNGSGGDGAGGNALSGRPVAVSL